MRLREPSAILFVLLGSSPLCHAQTVYSSTWGVSATQQATAVATDAAGNTYIAGWTDSPNFPVINPGFPRGGGVDAFLIKLNSSWNVVFATYLGGEGDDLATALALDSAGNIYVAGTTTSITFAGTVFASTGGDMDGFVAKIDPTGQHLIYAVSLGGSLDDMINGMTVTGDGHVWVAGATMSSNLPVVNALQSTLNGAENALIAELDPSGNVLYCSYLGGNGSDVANAITMDGTGDLWLAGATSSANFPAVQPVQPSLAGPQNAFVTKLSANGATILFSSWLGGSGGVLPPPEGANAIAVDSAGNAYVAGVTNSPNFPMLNAWEQFQGWNNDAFLASFNSAGQLRFSTCLGGSQEDVANAVNILPTGYILLAGYTMSPDFPQTVNPTAWHSGYNGFLAEFDPLASTLLYSAYLNLGVWDVAMAATSSSSPVVAGSTASTSPPLTELASAVEFSIPPPPMVSLTLSASPAAAGTITPFPAYGQGGYPVGSKVCLTATPGTGWVFSGWTGITPDSSGCFIMTANTTAIAMFTPIQYQLTLTASPAGAGSISATPAPVNGTYSYGTNVCLAASPIGGWVFSSWSGDALDSNGCILMTANHSVVADYTGVELQFVPLTPCRAVDTRNAAGPFGGPALVAQASRDFVIPQSSCGIPATALAYSLNVTVVPQGALGYLTIWPSGQPRPAVSTLNSRDGRVKANAAIVAAGAGGAVSVFASSATQLVLDISGYFVAAGFAPALAFYPLQPCRLVDTRNAPGPLGGPYIQAQQTRSFPILSSSCNVPSTATAYSLNATAVPHGPLGYVTVWPTGQNRPLASLLNALTGTVTANAILVPAGSAGAISVFATNKTDIVLDINGYFAPPGSGGLSLYTVVPCRVLDTRLTTGQFSGELVIDVAASACSPPATAQAFVFNATVVPPGPMGYLTLWPDGEAQPLASTLNAVDGAITSNMTIVPSSDGCIDAFADNPTQLLLDLSGYFAP